MREDLREKLRIFERWVRRRVWEAFAHKTGIAGATEESQASVPASSDDHTLEYIEQMAPAIATMARPQPAFEQHVDARLVRLYTKVVAFANG